MGPTALGLVAGIIDRIEGSPRTGPGHPRAPTEEVLATLRFFLREGVQWRELRAEPGRSSGSTLRRRLIDWSAMALLRRVHAVLVQMVRSGPAAAAAAWEVVADSCSVRAKRGGELTGPNPTDRGKSGTKYHVIVTTDGIPLAALPSAANVHDTRLFPGSCAARWWCAWPLHGYMPMPDTTAPRTVDSAGAKASNPSSVRGGNRMAPVSGSSAVSSRT